MKLRIRTALPLAVVLLGLFAIPAAAQAAAAQHVTWHGALRLEQAANGGFAGVSCPTAAECIAVDETGRVIYTTDARGGRSKWHFATVDKVDHGVFAGISCPSTKLCVAVDQTGEIVHSTDPVGGAKKWSRPLRVDGTRLPGGGYAGFAAISCPTVGLCVAVDNSVNGGVVVSTDPTGGQSAWHRIALANNTSLDAVSCESVSLCAVGGSREYYSTNPAGGSSAWHAGGVMSGGSVAGLKCTTPLICVGVGYTGSNDGVGFVSSDVLKGPSSWHRTNIEPDVPTPTSGLMDAISCPNHGFCVALDSNDNAYITRHPGANSWVTTPDPIRKSASATRSVIACHESVCVALDSSGFEVTGVVSG